MSSFVLATDRPFVNLPAAKTLLAV